MRISLNLLFVLLGLLVSACQPDSLDLEAEKEALLAIHQRVLQAHLNGDVDDWMKLEANEYISANRGTISYPSMQQRRQMREGYLGATTFSSYRDLTAPVVTISDDGSLGWLIAEVEAIGIQESPSGQADSIHAIWAWIELYKKGAEGWEMVGNVSNSRP